MSDLYTDTFRDFIYLTDLILMWGDLMTFTKYTYV